MKFKIIVILILVIISSGIVSAQTYEDKESLTILETIDNTINLISEGSSFKVNSVEANFKIRPLETYRQNIQFIETNSESTINDNSIQFIWTNPSTTKLNPEIESQIKTLGTFVPIKNKVEFPLNNINTEEQKYLQLTNTIDSNADIAQLATSLAGNEDDLFMIEFILADWVNKNIEYNLSSLASEANQASSWVLENKYGVCDEITNLFISLNRALGIPARFVSGIAYTDSELFDENWGNHGWSEVYFPNIGWVPYDVTYQQYGYVDATHIALEKNIDGAESSAVYDASGFDFRIETETLNYETTIISEGNNLPEKTTLILEAIEEEIGFGSYNVVKAKIKNRYNNYLVERVTISKTNNLEMISPYTQVVALKPLEEKTIYWLMKVENNLDDRYTYSFPVSVSRSIGEAIETSFEVSSLGEIYSKEYMEQHMQEQYIISEVLPLNCKHKENIFPNEEAKLTCSLSETEKMPISICLENNCQEIKNINDEIIFDLNTENIGFQTIKLHNPKTKESIYITYKVSDKSKLKLGEIIIPEQFTYNQKGSLEINIERESLSSPENISLFLDHDLFVQKWPFEQINNDQTIRIELTGSQLKKGNNDFLIRLTYSNNFGENIIEEKTVNTELVLNSTKEKISVFMNTMNGKISKLITKNISADTEEDKIKIQDYISIITIILVGLVILFTASKVINFFRRKE